MKQYLRNMPTYFGMAVLVIVIYGILSQHSHAQGPSVLCRNIMYPDIVQVFNEYSCPHGWTPE